MNARQPALRRGVPFERNHSLEAPPAVLEGGYYAYLAYASLAPELGLVIPLAGLGSLMALTACFVLRRGATIAGVLHSIRLPLACAVSFVCVRMLVHGESLSADYLRDTPAWVCTLVIAHSLCLRPGFLQRFPLAMFAIGLPALRSLRQIDWGVITSAGEEVVRAAGSGPLSNSNGMAFWFGFCAIYFAVRGARDAAHVVASGGVDGRSRMPLRDRPDGQPGDASGGGDCRRHRVPPYLEAQCRPPGAVAGGRLGRLSSRDIRSGRWFLLSPWPGGNGASAGVAAGDRAFLHVAVVRRFRHRDVYTRPGNVRHAAQSFPVRRFVIRAGSAASFCGVLCPVRDWSLARSPLTTPRRRVHSAVVRLRVSGRTVQQCPFPGLSLHRDVRSRARSR